MYNNFDYLIQIYYNDDNIIFNGNKLISTNNFEINTKIINQEFELNNLNLDTHIKIKISVININFKDNTKLEILN